jgi:membrane protease YdiL (CAAX protease family)
MHAGSVPLHGLAALFILSIGFGIVYERTGRLTGPVVMHVGFNAGNLVMASAISGG